jgi:hypothetical protein
MPEDDKLYPKKVYPEFQSVLITVVEVSKMRSTNSVFKAVTRDHFVIEIRTFAYMTKTSGLMRQVYREA